jgi:hypothetical protein
MNPNRRMYIDSLKIKELQENMTVSELFDFLSKRLIIPIDDKTYDFLILLKNVKTL